MTERKTKRHWRFYKTSNGTSPLDSFLDALTDTDYAAIDAGMDRVAKQGVELARHLRDDIYEVRVWGENRGYRVLFAAEGRFKQVLLGLHGFTKKTQRTPPHEIELAETRLADWRSRARKSPVKK